jgi:hypothetical protein
MILRNASATARACLLAALVAALGAAGCAGAPPAKQAGNPAVLAAEKARADLVVQAPPNRSDKTPAIMVHYMPWFQAPWFVKSADYQKYKLPNEPDDPTKVNFGFHWHMGSLDPFKTDAKGYAEVATHYYPLTGPYDSRDPVILEYQTLLMKIAGIDGVIIDWYGVGQALDYPNVHAASQALFAKIKAANLKFSVCYEDQSLGKMVQAKAITLDQAVDAAKESLTWVDKNWMSDPCYLRVADKPLLLDFGPQFTFKGMSAQAAWKSIFSALSTEPYFDTLDDHLEAEPASGIYPWPPMWASTSGTLSPARLVDYLNNYYKKTNQKPALVTSAFPRFHDFYQQAGVAASYGYLDYADGQILKLTLEASRLSKPDVVQIVTWNDYGEGTIVEPSAKSGYRDLEEIQAFRKGYEPAFPYAAADLRIPLGVFKMRIDPKLPADKAARLDALFAAAASGDAAKVKAIAVELGIAK